MQKELQSINLTEPVVLPDAVAQAIRGAQSELTTKLNTANLSAGWVPAKSLDPKLRAADRRFHHLFGDHHGRAAPGSTEQVMDRELAVRAIGRQHADDQYLPVDLDQLLLHVLRDGVRAVDLPGLSRPSRRCADGAGLAAFRALTPSQDKTGKYFLVVALVFLASQGAGAIMAHSYYERATFYGIQLNYILPFNFLRELPSPGADHLDRRWAGSRAACSSPPRSPADARRKARACSSICCSG